MGLFDKKYCDICGEKIGLLGKRKLDDGNMCKDCAGLLSPFTTDRRKTSIADIKEHLAYREENKSEVEAFNATRSIGKGTKLIVDEGAGKFIVTSLTEWKNENPDVIQMSQVLDCQTEIRESKTELKGKDKEGNEIRFNPPRYDIDFDFYITIDINSPWFNRINYKINNRRIESYGSSEYREAEQMSNEVKEILTKGQQAVVREEPVIEDVVTENVIITNGSKVAQICSYCGATTTPNEKGCCEYCGGHFIVEKTM